MRAGPLKAVEDAHARVAPGIYVKPRLVVHVVVREDVAAERAVQEILERIHSGIVGARDEDVEGDVVADFIRIDKGGLIVEVQADRGLVQPVV